MDENQAILETQMQHCVGRSCGPQHAWDPVNSAMIRHWCEAMGDNNPNYSIPLDAVAPPTMLQAWTMKGYADQVPPGSSDENPFEVLSLLDDHGYTGTVAVNCDQEYLRYLRLGEKVYHYGKLDSISEHKTTQLGDGYFVIVSYSFYVQTEDGKGELVGTMAFRLLKFKPAQQENTKTDTGQSTRSRKPTRPAPGINRDNAFFWEGLQQGKLLIQQCSSCQTLRHPPGPMCPKCHSLDWNTQTSSGKGFIYSYVNLHHPQIPPFDSPNPIALVELEEGTRIIGGLVGIKPGDVSIGQPVNVHITEEDSLTLALFKVSA